MRFLHTADWHLGKTLRGRSRAEEHRTVLAEITALALGSISIGAMAAMIALLPLPRASQPALTLTVLFPVLCLLATAAAIFGAFKVLDSRGASKPAIG